MKLTDADSKGLEAKGFVRKNTSRKILTKSGEKTADERWNELPAEVGHYSVLDFWMQPQS